MESSPFVFISYAHLNQEVVLPCIKAMQDNGINLWYDSGIEAGSEWPEFIAQKVAGCTKFVLFVSKAYVESQNCKRELNFAISRKKDILSVFVEELELPLGIEMQLGSYQAIHKNRFADDASFQTSLANERYFTECRLSDTQPQPAPSVAAEPAPSVATEPAPSVATEPAPSVVAESAPVDPVVDEPQTLPKRSRILNLVIAYFAGFLGLQKIYLKQPKKVIWYILLFWTGIPAVVSLAEAVVILFAPKAWLEKKYHIQFTIL